MIWRPPGSTLFPYTTLFRSGLDGRLIRTPAWQGFEGLDPDQHGLAHVEHEVFAGFVFVRFAAGLPSVAEMMAPYAQELAVDRKSTRLNSSHVSISYAVFCLKNDLASAWVYTLSLHDALPIWPGRAADPHAGVAGLRGTRPRPARLGARRARGVRRLRLRALRCGTSERRGDDGPLRAGVGGRSEEHTSELQSRFDLVCRLLLEK